MSELKTPMNLATAYPGRFLKAASFCGKKVTLTVQNVVHDELEGEKGTKELKVIMIFKETPLAMVLAKINAVAISGMFGKSIPAWIGRRITFFPTDQIMPMPTAKGDDRICIRVWGSPDIDTDMNVEFKIPRRRPLMLALHKTGKDVGSVSTTEPQKQPTVEAPPELDGFHRDEPKP